MLIDLCLLEIFAKLYKTSNYVIPVKPGKLRVTEVDKELPACNFDEHYSYINTSTPYPR